MTEQRTRRSAGADSKQAPRKKPPSAGSVARRASDELADLLDREPEGIVSVERTDDGWRVGVEFVDVRRIPETADVLVEYSVDTDRSGGLVGYHRVRRYLRGRPEDGR
ncbi:MAG TPA: gas vesicle protein [Jatrophihabitans sp.]|nr:gas vesicle protein [Jatrophihabitans sp.]